MNLFGLFFILSFFKLLYGSSFWNNLQNDDINLYRRVTLAERLAKKLRKHELDLKFLVTTPETGVYQRVGRMLKIIRRNVKVNFIAAYY